VLLYYATIIAGALLTGFIAAVLIVRVQRRRIIDTFRAIAPQLDSSKSDPSEMLRSIASSYSSLLAQSTKDKAQLLTILSAMSDGLVAVDSKQLVLLVNHAAEQFFSIRGIDALEKPLWDVVQNKEILEAVQGVMLTGERKVAQVGPIDGRSLEITVARLPRTDQPAGLIILAHDMTEIAKYENLRKEFVANVSHELRTPLTMIKGFVETLKDGAIDDRPRAIQYLDTVQRHSDQLTNLVSDLLDLSRFDSGLEIPRGGVVHLDAVIRRAVELVTPAANKKGHRLTVQVEVDLPTLAGNADYLQRAVVNLLENAIKYTRDGGAIELKAGREGNMMGIEVSDNGIGIAADDLPRIFERFYRVDRSRSREMGGTGLGLSIVKHVVQAHGGAVDVSSVLNKGSSFKIRLPLIPRGPQIEAAKGFTVS